MSLDQRAVQEFHDKYCIDEKVGDSEDTRLRRGYIIGSEVAELYDALGSGSLAEVAKELADVIYTLYGTAISLGVDLDRVLTAVHQSNMSKSGPLDDQGKVVKGENYVTADLAFLEAEAV